MNGALFQSIAIVALLVGNVMLIGLGFMAARFFFGTHGAAQEDLSDLHQEVKSITFSLAAVSERLAKLEMQIGPLRESIDRQNSLNRDSDQKSFKIATKLALQGANVDEIVELCGLARGEAELIRMLHANSNPSANTSEPTTISRRPARVVADSIA